MRKINSETKEIITQAKIKWEKPRIIILGRNEQTQGQMFCVPFGSGDFMPPPPCMPGSFAGFTCSGGGTVI